MMRPARTLGGARGASLLLVLLLAGCNVVSVPSQKQPVCSWDVAVPANANSICAVTFRTLSAIVRAQVAGDNTAIRRLVPVPRVARRIIAYGTGRRAEGIIYLHVVPSITLGITAQGKLGAGFYVTGKTHSGKVSDPETVYLRVLGDRGVVIDDQPDEVW